MEFMSLSGGNLIIAGGIVVIAVGVPLWLNKHKTHKTIAPELTEKDKDLMELIGELAAVYENTDKYLNRD